MKPLKPSGPLWHALFAFTLLVLLGISALLALFVAHFTPTPWWAAYVVIFLAICAAINHDYARKHPQKGPDDAAGY